MKFEIGTPTQETSPKDAFVIEVEFMHGDADQYSHDKITESKHTPIATMLQIANGFETYFAAKKENYNKYCNGAWDTLQELIPDFDEVFADHWESNCFSDGEYAAAIENYQVYYYDLDGVKHNAEFKQIG